MKHQFGENQKSREFDLRSDSDDSPLQLHRQRKATIDGGRKGLNQTNLIPSRQTQDMMSQSMTSDFMKYMQDKQNDKMLKHAMQNNPSLVFQKQTNARDNSVD